jgi:hypothetical protein
MTKMGLKTLAAVLTIGLLSKKHIDWTLVIALFSTLVTVALVAAYILERIGII